LISFKLKLKMHGNIYQPVEENHSHLRGQRILIGENFKINLLVDAIQKLYVANILIQGFIINWTEKLMR
jgi:hypothetical protein